MDVENFTRRSTRSIFGNRATACNQRDLRFYRTKRDVQRNDMPSSPHSSKKDSIQSKRTWPQRRQGEIQKLMGRLHHTAANKNTHLTQSKTPSLQRQQQVMARYCVFSVEKALLQRSHGQPLPRSTGETHTTAHSGRGRGFSGKTEG